MILTLYQHRFDNRGQQIEQTWEEWLHLFMKPHEVRGNPTDTNNKDALDRAKDGPAVLLGPLYPGKNRAKANVLSAHALALDVDNATPEQVSSVFQSLNGVEYCAWTTHKNGSVVAGDKPRIRIIIPLTRPLTPAEHPIAWDALNRLTGGFNDPATKDISRLHYLPSTFDPQHADSMHNPGTIIDPSILLEKKQTTNTSKKHTEDPIVVAERVRRKLRHANNLEELTPAARALAKGEPFAEPGERHSSALRLTNIIAYSFPQLSEEELYAVFEPSLSKMNTDPSDIFDWPDVWRTYTDMVGKIKVIERKEQESRGDGVFYTQEEFDNIVAEHPEWPIERFAEIARVQGWSGPETVKQRWIIQRDGTCWFLKPDGTYSAGWSSKDVPMAFDKFLGNTPVPLLAATKEGNKKIPQNIILSKFGTLANRVVADLSAQYTTFDPHNGFLREAVSPVRKDLTPRYSPEIDGWLKILGGKNYEKLIDWLSVAPDLTKPLCAIYFRGDPGTGKTLLAYGVAKLWTQGPPSPIAEILLREFNSEIVRCPLILADESIPQKKEKDATAVLRSLLSTTSRSLSRKFRDTVELIGAVRLILAANNEFLLEPPPVATREDIQAIAERFLEIEIDGSQARQYLEYFDRGVLEYWEKRGIAEHVLWLHLNHTIRNPGRRFLVEGELGKMHRTLVAGVSWNAYCYEWIVNYLMSSAAPMPSIAGFVRVMGQRLYVCNQALIKGWGSYLETKDSPNTSKINAALRAISSGPKRQLRRVGKRHHFYEIDIDGLCSWSETEAVGDPEEIRERLARDNSDEILD